MTWAFQKRWSQGQKRSSKVKNRWKKQKRSNFNIFQKQTNYTSQWSSSCKLSKKVSLKVIEGHQRSRIAGKGQKGQISCVEQTISSEAGGSRDVGQSIISSKARGLKNLGQPTTSSKARGLRNLEQPITSSEEFTQRASFWRGICVFNLKFEIWPFWPFPAILDLWWPSMTLRLTFSESLHEELHCEV